MTFGVMVNLGDEDWLWVTDGTHKTKQFSSHKEALDYAKQVWSVAWENNRIKVQEVLSDEFL